MKTLILTLAIAIFSNFAKATTYTITNGLTGWLYYQTTDGSDVYPSENTIGLDVGQHSTFTNNKPWLYLMDSAQDIERYYQLPTTEEAYTVLITDIESSPSWQPVAVPEPTAFTIFMYGFASVFAPGFMGIGAKWTRQIMSSHESLS